MSSCKSCCHAVKINKEYLYSGLGLLKILSLVFGFVAFGVGSYSYYESDWKQYNSCCDNCYNYERLQGFSKWNLFSSTHNGSADESQHIPCPALWLETFYIVVITIVFTLTTIWLVVVSLSGESKIFKQKPCKVVDAVYHAAGSIIVIIVGSILLYSSTKIEQVLEDWERRRCECYHDAHSSADQLLTGGKIMAGVLTLKLGILYAIISVAIFRQLRHSSDDDGYSLMF